MERKRPVPGTFYRHFKGNIYQVRELAKDSETGEDMVIYQGMYPPFQVWVRTLSMFLDRVDQDKYPECRQQYRFEPVVFRETLQRDIPKHITAGRDAGECSGQQDRLCKQTGDGTGE